MSVTPPTYAERATAAIADLDAQVQSDLAALNSPEEPTASRPPTPPPADATAKAAGGDGAAPPKATTPESTAAPSAADAPPATEGEEEKPLSPAEVKARIAEATRRAQADQSKTARQLESLKAELAQARAAAEQARFDAQTLYQAQQEAKSLARQQGGVRYEDLDAAQEKALRDQSSLRQQEMIARQNGDQQQAAITAAQQREVAQRSADAANVHTSAVADVLSAAAEAGIKLTRAEATDLVNAGHNDPIVVADKELWRDLNTPSHVAKSRIEVVGKRLAEQAIAALTQRAIAKVEEQRQAVPTYDRTQVHGASNGTVAAQRPMTYKERHAAALADIEESVREDMKKFAPTVTVFNQ